jgi:hypothetical protein
MLDFVLSALKEFALFIGPQAGAFAAFLVFPAVWYDVYVANLENFLNFDIRLAKRMQLYGSSIHRLVAPGDKEKEFALDQIRGVG